ncbi:hypothetical protein [Streptomyces sp. TLI_185]|uniref:hypothetical protein n=1 Tax=Streptomyces sp. TLI_185 TaxID=2485151 RepID=UPI000F4F1C3B|nr:hypothetical protein [Streptomyces sp. TLI_185]RPF33802.1 hypothetical protein EDD92_3729 [Streptomyces sp. TLI_185]
MNLGLTWTWNSEIRTSDIVAIVALVLAITTASFAYRQLRVARVNIENVRKQLSETSRTNRARFLFDVVKWYLDDKSLREMFYRLDYGQWVFDPRTFPMSDEEPVIDHLLFVYDIVGYYAEAGVIDEEELPLIRFEASQVLRNAEIVKYLTWLDSEYEKVGVAGEAYAHARKLSGRITHS